MAHPGDRVRIKATGETAEILAIEIISNTYLLTGQGGTPFERSDFDIVSYYHENE